jgi:peptide/nickel transport system substrate-binding protein
VAAAGLLATGCSSTSSGKPETGARVNGGTVTWAEPPGAQPNWIWPFTPATNYTVYNGPQFQWLMYRPLYMFGNNGLSTTVNYALSLARAPVYKGTTVTISMKGWKWSNGEAVDAKDVIFWLNMMEVEKANYAGYVPGLMPDNLVSYKASGPNQVTLTLSRPNSSYWFTYNQLAEITPMPLAWDVTKLGAAPGSGGCAASVTKCKAVFAFLTAQAKSTSTYTSSPIWGVVDGPWKLSAFSADGHDTFVPNKSYSGSPKPKVRVFKEVPYTGDFTEYTALKTGAVDVGYVPVADLPQRAGNSALPANNPLGSAYTLEPGYNYIVSYYLPNFNNSAVGWLFRQLYVRQALQYVDDQLGMDRVVYRGYAYPTSGPVPNEPPNPWIPDVQRANGGQGPYPFSIARAKNLLTSHGWSQVGGVMTCQEPTQCGANIQKGEQLKFTLYYTTGIAAFTKEAAVYKSDASKAGIEVNIVGQTFNAIVGEGSPCQMGGKCGWQAQMVGGWVFNGPGFEPTGEPLFQTGAASNSGRYSNRTEDTLINLTHTSSSLSVFHNYATFTAEQLPVIWMPNTYNVQAVNSKLHNVTFNSLGNLFPEYWYFTK